MRWIRFAVFILIVTILQASLVDVFAVTKLNIKPNLLLILVVFFSIYCNSTDAIIISFTTGFAADIIGPMMGPQMISFGLFGTLLAYLNRIVAIRKMTYQAGVIFITVFLAFTLAHLLTTMKSSQAISNIYVVIFGTAIYSAIIGPFLFSPSAWCMGIKTYHFSKR